MGILCTSSILGYPDPVYTVTAVTPGRKRYKVVHPIRLLVAFEYYWKVYCHLSNHLLFKKPCWAAEMTVTHPFHNNVFGILLLGPAALNYAIPA